MTEERLLDVFLWPMSIKPRLSEVPPEADRGFFVPERPDGSLKIQAQLAGLLARSPHAHL